MPESWESVLASFGDQAAELVEVDIYRRQAEFHWPLLVRETGIPMSRLRRLEQILPYGMGTDEPVTYLIVIHRDGAPGTTRTYRMHRVGPAAPFGWVPDLKGDRT
jgi:hypothetical protein